MSNTELKRQPRSLRPRDQAPYCWFARAALESIGRSPEITNQARAKLVYVAGHVVEASRQGKAIYRAPKALIARHAHSDSDGRQCGVGGGGTDPHRATLRRKTQTT